MASLVVVFYIFLVIFGIIGAGRGWAKELLVIFSTILGLALLQMLEKTLPATPELLQNLGITNPAALFWFRALILTILVIFGYQTPKFSRLAPATARRDAIQELLLGLLLGLISGYLLVGSLWYFMNQAQYPFQPHISPPPEGSDVAKATEDLMKLFLPNTALGQQPWIYVIVILAFVFVVVVFL
jgi:uncharacterized membrane protein required for colicin V production